MRAPVTDEVVVLDFGGQYSQLIARRVRECGVFSELLPHHVGAAEVRRRKPRGVILSGGPASVYADGAPKVDPEIFELGIPTLGICYGAQLLALDLGGTVERTGASEFGKTELTAVESELFAGLPEEETVWMSHRDTVVAAPEGANNSETGGALVPLLTLGIPGSGTTAVLLAALMLAPMRWWWALLLAAFPVHLIAELQDGVPPAMVLCWFVSNVSEALIGALCVRRFLSSPALDTIASTVIFFWGAVLLAPFVSMHHAGAALQVFAFLVRWTLTVALLLLAVGLLVRHAPATAQPLPWVSLGAAIVIVSWVIVSLVFYLYLTRIASYQSVFGSLAAVIIAMGYLYISTTVFLFGAQLDAIIRARATGAPSGLGPELRDRSGIRLGGRVRR